MYKSLLVLALLLYTLPVLAQNKATIKGKVIDSTDHKPIEFVTVAVLTIKDTTSILQSYTITDKTGAFSLHNLPIGVPLKVFMSNVAYRPYRKIVTLIKGQELDLGEITLNTNQLNQVTITADRPPITIRKDTIEFNAEAFKTRPNAVVEDLLKKLPGVEVDMRGKVTVQGHDVSKVLVDGHEFFSNDYRIATKNVDVDLIDKILVYEDREDDPEHLKPSSQVNRIINVKFKKALKRSMFGKVNAGGGTRDRYSTGGLFNVFRDTLQVSLIGIANNLNGTGFSYTDLSQSGGFNRGGSNTFFKGGLSLGNSDELYSYDNNENGASGFSGFGGSDQQRSAAGGFNINQDYGKKLKINLAYFYNNSHNRNNFLYSSQRFRSDTTFTGSSDYSNQQDDIRHNISASIEWKPRGDTTKISYRPSFSYDENHSFNGGTSQEGSNFLPLINITTANNTSNSKNTQFEQSFNYDHKFKKKGESVSFSHQLSINPNNGESYSLENLTSYTAQLASFLQNRHEYNESMNSLVSLSAGYRYPFTKKLTGFIDVYTEYIHHKNDDLPYDFNAATNNYDIFLPLAGITVTRNMWQQNISPGLSYEFKGDIKLTVTGDWQQRQVDNQFGRNTTDVNQKFSWLLPNISFNWGDYSLSYRASYDLPRVEDMKPYSIAYNPRYIDYGNPNLKPTRRDAFSFNYRKYWDKPELYIYGDLGYNFERNSVFRHQTLDGVGNTTSTPINMDGKFTWSGRSTISKNFKFNENFSLKSNTGLSISRSRSYFEINSQGGFQNNFNYAIKQEFAITWKDLVQLEESYRINSSTTKYTDVTYDDVKYITHVVNSHLILTWPKVLNIESTYAYVYNPRVAPGFKKSANLLNISMAHLLLAKDRGEIKLSCYDILNQNVSQLRFISGNNITDMQNQILRRYFLLTLQFKFNKTITK
ncbi:MAG: outer membrane beta-barrel protein [Bacteroidota bacterium]